MQNIGTLEMDRKKFVKREKWNTVIQFHKKKRILLRHLKATGNKWFKSIFDIQQSFCFNYN